MSRVLLLSVLLTLAACASVRQIPPELQYSPPVDGSSLMASIKGSQIERHILDDFTAYVIAVDGKRVMALRKGWNVELPILPGSRTITIAFQRGVYNAQVDLSVDATAGSKYEVRFISDVGLGFYDANTYCDFWIIDLATKKPVTEVRRGIIGGGGQTAVPIFIYSN